MTSVNDEGVDLTRPETRGRFDSQRKYWHEFEPDCFLGYQKFDQVRVWMACWVHGKDVIEERIALADDFEDADGVRVMSFDQARSTARNWCAQCVVEAAQQPIDDGPFMTAGPACGRI